MVFIPYCLIKIIKLFNYYEASVHYKHETDRKLTRSLSSKTRIPKWGPSKGIRVTDPLDFIGKSMCHISSFLRKGTVAFSRLSRVYDTKKSKLTI